jgi:hypothetical protein
MLDSDTLSLFGCEVKVEKRIKTYFRNANLQLEPRDNIALEAIEPDSIQSSL